MLKKIKLSPLRKFMIWAFGSPANDPYVVANLDFEFDPALEFLHNYNQVSKEKITIHHFMVKTLADTLALHPKLNVKIFSNDLYQLPSITIACPVNLVHDKWVPGSNELGIIIVRDADKKSLEQIAVEIRERCRSYRKKGSAYLLEDAAQLFSQVLPDFSFRALFKGMGLLKRSHHVYDFVQEIFGASTVFTNLGAAVSPKKGMHFKTVSLTLPDKVMHLSTCFGAGALEKKVLAENDQPVIRTVLPMMMIFDHRVIDGYLMNCFAQELSDHILHPQKYLAQQKEFKR